MIPGRNRPLPQSIGAPHSRHCLRAWSLSSALLGSSHPPGAKSIGINTVRVPSVGSSSNDRTACGGLSPSRSTAHATVTPRAKRTSVTVRLGYGIERRRIWATSSASALAKSADEAAAGPVGRSARGSDGAEQAATATAIKDGAQALTGQIP